jgi:hypothetical protein
MLRTGSPFDVASIIGPLPSMVTGAKLVFGSNGSLDMIALLIV